MPTWVRLVVAVTAVRAAVTMVVRLSAQPTQPFMFPVPAWVYVLLLVALTGVGLGLAFGNRHDLRAAWLGALLVLVGAPLAKPVIADRLAEPALRLAYDALKPEVFMGVCLWQFAARFPSSLESRLARRFRVAAGAAMLVGLLCAGIALTGQLPQPRLSWWLARSVAEIGSWQNLFWPLVQIAGAPVLLVLAWRARAATGEDSWRIRVFVAGLVVGFAPFSAELLLEAFWPAYRAFAHAAAIEPWVGLLIFGALATVPFVTAYSVLFNQVVEVRVVLRAAAQYALARYTILGATLVPFAALGVFLIQHRQEPLVSLFASGPRPVVLSGSVMLGMATLRLRSRWLNALDRRYFREAYDSRQILTRIVGQPAAGSPREIAAWVANEIQGALHADVEVFLADEAHASLRHVNDRLPPLGTTATLTELAMADTEPMNVDLAPPSSPLRRLRANEQQWLRRGNFALLVGVRRADGGPAALLALAPKRSGLPYSSEDRRVLSAAASATGLALDSLRLRTTESGEEPPARECGACSRLHPPDALRCVCGGDLRLAAVPHLLRGVFRLEQRIGAGGMGVVYRAIDLNLDRAVAIKALPRVTPEHIVRLRGEARAMAVVTHPNLAVIHGVETWQDTPFLVQEYLAGGTLADRLARSKPTPYEVISLGITLAECLESLHAHRVVHCDIKPSNIGFTEAGVVKVLDFGLARLLRGAGVVSHASTTAAVGAPSFEAIQTEGPFGTLQFMSPEALLGSPPSPAFDLWALAVVLYEAVAGRRPFEAEDATGVRRRILSASPPDVREYRPDAPPGLASLLSSALAGDAARRPASAAVFAAALRRVE